jgi:hypothetical protein
MAMAVAALVFVLAQAGVPSGEGIPVPPPSRAAAPRPAMARAAPAPVAAATSEDPAKAAWDLEISELAVQSAVHPTGQCPDFEARWGALREWLIRELDAGASVCTYTQLMQLRFRHLRGDESAHQRLDELLSKARDLLSGRAVEAELRASGGNPQG